MGQIMLGIAGLLLGVILVWSLFAWLQKKLLFLDRGVNSELPKC
jgi:hypothetical protein